MSPTNSPIVKPPAGIGVRYDETAALYTSQVVVNSIGETVLLECSSGFVRSDTGKAILPIEQRLAMTTATARRLGNLLLEVADEMEALEDGEGEVVESEVETELQADPGEESDTDSEYPADTALQASRESETTLAIDAPQPPCEHLGRTWLTQAAQLQRRMRCVLERFPRVD